MSTVTIICLVIIMLTTIIQSIFMLAVFTDLHSFCSNLFPLKAIYRPSEAKLESDEEDTVLVKNPSKRG